MIKRTIEISQRAVHLCVRNGQLLIRPRGGEAEITASIPCEDIGCVLVDEPGTTWTHQAMGVLLNCGATVVVCGRDHLPAGVLLPLPEHTQVVPRIHAQIAVTAPVKKQLWRQIVTAKVLAQADNLPQHSAAHDKIAALARRVRSGDPDNVESQAARIYWANWLSEPSGSTGEDRPASSSFRRDTDGEPPNNLLNYGYATLRAAVARALVAAGLVPALGLHHHNRSNPFCLADDLMEPLRPLVDSRVRTLIARGCLDLDQPAKAELLGVLTQPVRTGEEVGPLMVALHRYVASLVDVLEGLGRRLTIPVRASEEPEDGDPC